MDLSKLPKFSQTPPPPGEPPAPDVPAPPIAYRTVEPAVGRGAEAWISVGLGLILMFVFPHFSQWLIYAVFHTKLPDFLPITDANGAQVPYPRSIFFMSDLCVALFAYALIVEGIALFLARRTGLVIFAMIVTAAAVLLNLYYVVDSFSTGQGFAVVSAVAVLVGGYMAMYQWRLIGQLRRLRAFELSRLAPPK